MKRPIATNCRQRTEKTLKTLVTELEKKKEELNKIKVGNLQKLDEQISSMMTKTANKNYRRAILYACNTCGKVNEYSHFEEKKIKAKNYKRTVE